MKKKSNRIWIILGVLVLALIAFLVIGKKVGWIGKPDAAEVEFIKVGRESLTETVSASGKIQPELEVQITPDVPGEIIGLYIEEGDSVKKGQLLLKIQPQNYLSVVDRFKAGVNQAKAAAAQSKAQIARAESSVMRQEQEYKRQKGLLDEKVISLSDFQTAETNLLIGRQDLSAAKANYEAAEFGIKSAEANLKDALENLRKTNIYAPMSGIVSKLDVELGERVVGTSQMAGTEMLRIADLNNMEVRVNVNENDIVRVSKNDTVLIDVDSYSSLDKEFKGIVTQIANTANGVGGALGASSASTEAVTEFEVLINILPSSYSDLLAESKYPFKPGMTATVEIVTEKKDGILTVPIAAVTTRANDDKDDEEEEERFGAKEVDLGPKEEVAEIVFVSENGKAKKKVVTTGITDTVAGKIEILSGIEEGDEVISGPYIEVSKRLKEGKEVTSKSDKKKEKE